MDSFFFLLYQTKILGHNKFKQNCCNKYTSNIQLQRTFPARTRDILDGQSSRSRFGIALTGLGDINFDGYDGKSLMSQIYRWA